VTVELFVVTVFPAASCTATVTAGLTVVPAEMLVGCCVKPSPHISYFLQE